MDQIHLCGDAPSIYSDSILSAFVHLTKKRPRVGVGSDSIRFIGRGIRGIKKEDAVDAIDNQHLGCPLLTLQDLPPDHHVRTAIGGRPCVGVFARRDVVRRTVLGVYAGKWYTVEEFQAVERTHHPSYHRFVFEFKEADGRSCYVDATEAGNITREMNHYEGVSPTGAPNVQFVQVVDVRTGLPHVLVVALADIREGKEATLDYGPDYFPNLVSSLGLGLRPNPKELGGLRRRLRRGMHGGRRM